MEQYVAYVGSYTKGKSKGITIYDVDMENGCFIKRKEIEAGNPSFMVKSNSGKYLYVATDCGITAFEIMKNGELKNLHTTPIYGMRASHLSISEDDKYVFSSGFHDGKFTVVYYADPLKKGKVTDEMFNQGVGKIMEPNSTPHITCSAITGDKKYLAVCDLGIDQIKIMELEKASGKLNLIDIIRGELQASPRSILFSGDGAFAYVAREVKNEIAIYSYKFNGEEPVFELVDTVEAVTDPDNNSAATSVLRRTEDSNYILCTNAGDDSITIFKRNPKTGKLTLRTVLKVSGEFPKDIMIFPDARHIASLNHSSGEITFFRADFENNMFTMSSRPISTDTPNCGVFVKI